MVGDRRQGWTLLAAMLVILVPLMVACTMAEQAGNPALGHLGIDQIGVGAAGRRQHGRQGNRLGIVNSTIWNGDDVRFQRLG